MHTVSLQQARNIQITTLGLNNPPILATKFDVLNAIQNMSYLQIDTINVINRSPYLVLYSRIGYFQTNWITELLEERKLFEYWSHEASFLPIEDYPLYHSIISSKGAHRNHWSEKWIRANKKDTNHVLNYIKTNGNVMSSTFTKLARQSSLASQNIAEEDGSTERKPAEEDGRAGRSASEGGLASQSFSDGWWNWKTEKLALEALFLRGDITIVGRKNFHRVYDLTEKFIPEELFKTRTPLSEVYEEMIIRTVKHLGITKKDWIPDYFRIPKTIVYKVFEKLQKKNLFLETEVEGVSEKFFVHPDNEILLSNHQLLTTNHIKLLSPFDPLVCNRKRLKELFDFDYQIECYTPASKRKYGYFSLPILYNGEIIGRMDSKAHRKEGVFEVKALYIEKEVKDKKTFVQKLKAEIQKFANWHKTPKFHYSRIVPNKYKDYF